MADDNRDLLVRILGDDRSLQSAFTRTERRTKQFEGRMAALNQSTRGFLSGFGSKSSLLFGSGAFIGAAGLTAALKSSTEAASDLNEQINKTREVFGTASGSVEDWSQTTASAFGISQRAALEAVGTFGNLFRVIDIGPDKAGKMSQALVELAADLASFNNADPSDVLLALRSGLIGEAEPLRRYGVLLSEARVQQQAMADTGKKNVRELTNQEKTMARYEIIVNDTAIAQGDFARTSDGLANQQRTLRAETEDLSAAFGNALVPSVQLATTALIGLVGGMNDAIVGGRRLRSFFKSDDTFDGFNEGVQSALDGVISFGKGIRDQIPGIERFLDLRDRFVGSEPPVAPRFEGSPDARDRFNQSVEEQKRALEKAGRELDATGKQFGAHLKGLGLKLDRAGLTATTADDLAVLREIEASIQRQIRREGRTFALVQELTRVRGQIASTISRQAEQQARTSRDAWEELLDSLNLNLERALGTAKLDDDLAALRKIESAIKKRIAAEGKTLELERQLLDTRRQIAETRRQQVQGKQFDILGLTSEGEKKGPSVKNLRQRATRLEDQIQGTVLDTAKTRSQLQRIARVLSGDFGKVGKDVRAAILAMLNDIASALKDGSRKTADAATASTGEITRGGIRSTDMLLRGLGLTPEQEQELRKRNLGVSGRRGLSAFGMAIGQPSSGATPSGAAGFGGGAGEPLIELHVFLDGKEVESTVTRRQIKKGRRTAASRRGRAGANKLGVG